MVIPVRGGAQNWAQSEALCEDSNHTSASPRLRQRVKGDRLFLGASVESCGGMPNKLARAPDSLVYINGIVAFQLALYDEN